MEKQLNLSGKKFPRISSLSVLQEIQKRLDKKEHPARRVQCQCAMTGIGKNDENCISNAEKVKNYAMKFSQEHWTFFGSTEEKWYGSSFYAQKRTMGFYSQRSGTAIQRNGSSCVQKYQCLESWDPEAEEGQKYHTLQWRFNKHRTLVPNSSICKSNSVFTEQWRIGVINSA